MTATATPEAKMAPDVVISGTRHDVYLTLVNANLFRSPQKHWRPILSCVLIETQQSADRQGEKQGWRASTSDSYAAFRSRNHGFDPERPSDTAALMSEHTLAEVLRIIRPRKKAHRDQLVTIDLVGHMAIASFDGEVWSFPTRAFTSDVDRFPMLGSLYNQARAHTRTHQDDDETALGAWNVARLGKLQFKDRDADQLHWHNRSALKPWVIDTPDFEILMMPVRVS